MEEEREDLNNLSLNYERLHSASKLPVDTNHQLFLEKPQHSLPEEHEPVHHNHSLILQNTSVLSNNSQGYNELFSNFDSVQKKIQELQDMAQNIIQKDEEEEDEDPLLQFRRNDEVDMTINMSCLAPQTKPCSDDTMINNVIDEVNQSIRKKIDNPSDQHFSQGLLNLEQQLLQIQSLKDSNKFYRDKVTYISKSLLAMRVDTAFLQDDSVQLQIHFSQDSVNQLVAKHRQEIEHQEKQYRKELAMAENKQKEIYQQLKDQIMVNRSLEKKVDEKNEQVRLAKEKVGEKDQKILDLYNQLKEQIKANQEQDKVSLAEELKEKTQNEQLQQLTNTMKASQEKFNDLENAFIQQVEENSPQAYLQKYNSLKQDTLTSLFQHVQITPPEKEQPIDPGQLVKLLRFYKQQNTLQKAQLEQLITATRLLYDRRAA